MSLLRLFASATLLLSLPLFFNACQTTGESFDDPKSAPEGTHQAFRSTPGWQGNRTFINQKLLAETNAENSRIVIVLDEQRALLFKRGSGADESEQVVIDTQVSTGKPGHATPTGSYTILNKKPDHRSNLYGNFVDETGKVVQSSVSTRKDTPPAGTKFLGASMPYWQRLTWTGIGMHVGYVPGRRTASHGCIRFPSQVMPAIYERTRKGTPVSIVSSYEFPYEYQSLLTGEGAKPAATTANSSTNARGVPSAPTQQDRGDVNSVRWFWESDVSEDRREGLRETQQVPATSSRPTTASQNRLAPPAPPIQQRRGIFN